MCDDFPLGTKILSKSLQSVFPVRCGANQLRLSVRLAASVNRGFPGFTREPDVGDFLSYRIVGKKVFAFPVLSFQLSNFLDLWTVTSVTNWPENIPRVKPIDRAPDSATAPYHLLDEGLFVPCLAPTVLQKVREAGVIFNFLKPAIQCSSTMT